MLIVENIRVKSTRVQRICYYKRIDSVNYENYRSRWEIMHALRAREQSSHM